MSILRERYLVDGKIYTNVFWVADDNSALAFCPFSRAMRGDYMRIEKRKVRGQVVKL
jgi:hypothetical protein